VHSIRTPESIIVTDGLCLAVPEALMQHFFMNNLFTFQVDITKHERLGPKNMNDNSGVDVTTRGSFSRQSSYNHSGLYLIEGDGERTAIDSSALNRNTFESSALNRNTFIFDEGPVPVAPVFTLCPNTDTGEHYKI